MAQNILFPYKAVQDIKYIYQNLDHNSINASFLTKVTALSTMNIKYDLL